MAITHRDLSLTNQGQTLKSQLAPSCQLNSRYALIGTTIPMAAPAIPATMHMSAIDVWTIPGLWIETIKLLRALTGTRTDSISSSISLTLL